LLKGLRAACQKTPRILVFRARCLKKTQGFLSVVLQQGFDADVAFYALLLHESRLTQNSSAAAAANASPQALLLQITDQTILMFI